MTLTLVVGLEYLNNPDRYVGGSVDTGRASFAGQVDGEESHEEVLQERTSSAVSVRTR